MNSATSTLAAENAGSPPEISYARRTTLSLWLVSGLGAMLAIGTVYVRWTAGRLPPAAYPFLIFIGVLIGLIWAVARSRHLMAWAFKNLALAYLILAGIVVISAWLFYLGFAQLAFDSWDDAGKFGDSFGAFGALIGALGFAGVVVNLIAQSAQLSEERTRHAAAEERHDRELAAERVVRAASDARQLEQTRLIQDQLTALQEQRREERAQYLLSIEPRFSVRLAHAAADCLRLAVVNTGAPICELVLVDDTARRVRLMDAPAVESGRESGILVTPSPAPEEVVEFELRYRRVADLGVAGQRFRLVGESSPRRVLAAPCAAPSPASPVPACAA